MNRTFTSLGNDLLNDPAGLFRFCFRRLNALVNKELC